MKRLISSPILLCAAFIAMAPFSASMATAEETVSAAPIATDNAKDIKQVSNVALKVLDKDCPNLVQPFSYADNFKSLSKFTLAEVTDKASNLVQGIFGAKPAAGTAANPDEIPDSLKLAAKQLNWLPMEGEVAYGQHLHEQETAILDRDSRLGKKYYPIADAMLAELLGKLTEPTEYKFQLFILKNSTRNAVARPGGFLYLDQGLLEKDEYRDKAYFAMAHEIAHVLQRHETRELQSMAVDSFTAKKDLVETLPKLKSDPALLLDHVKMGKDIYTQHNVDQELQADSCATRLLARLYPAPKLASTLQGFIGDLPPVDETVSATDTTVPKTQADKLISLTQDIVSTPMHRHPNSKERKENLDKMYRDITTPAK